MPGRVVVSGELDDRHEVERLLAELHPGLHVETVGRGWELVEKASSGGCDLAVLMPAPISDHEERVGVVTALRRSGFRGRILFAGAFLTEKQDAVRAGADYVFDPGKQRAEEVIRAALFRPVVAADHPYLRFLLLDEWARIVEYGDVLPTTAPDLLLAATSAHPMSDFWSRLAAYARDHPTVRCIIAEDDGSEEARIEALTTGIQPYVVLASEGLGQVKFLATAFLRERWMAAMARA